MEDNVIRPSMKLIRAGYSAVFGFLFLCVLAYNNSAALRVYGAWVLAVPALMLAAPARGHLARNSTKLTIVGDTLRFETGILRKSVRLVRVAMIQDVTIDQTLRQRLLGIGSVTVETANEDSDLTIVSVDQPEQAAQLILGAAFRQSGSKGNR